MPRSISFLIALWIGTLVFSPNLLASDTYNACGQKLGFEIKCYSAWGIKETANSLVFVVSRDPRVVVMISKMPTQKTKLEELTVPASNRLSKKTKEVFGGQKALKTKTRIPPDRTMDFYVIKDGYVYSVNFTVTPDTAWNNYQALFDEMIADFKFY